MNIRMNLLALAGVLAVSALVAGCLVSATFILVDDFEFTAQMDFYHYTVDITDEPDWDDHKDDIDNVDAVGVEFFITSLEPGPVTFSAYIDDFGSDYASEAEVESGATIVLEDLTVQPGSTHITYAQSLGYLRNVETLKLLTKTGMFEFYGTSTGSIGTTFRVDSGKVIATISGS